MNTPEQSALGKPSAYADQYDAGLLFPLPRLPKRQDIGLGTSVPFMGADLWTGYELSWLNPRGKPQVALAHFTVPCESPNIIESKSFKLYLNSFNNTRFADASPDIAFAVLAEVLLCRIWNESPTEEYPAVDRLN